MIEMNSSKRRAGFSFLLATDYCLLSTVFHQFTVKVTPLLMPLAVALMTTLRGCVPSVVRTVKVWVLLPAGMTMLLTVGVAISGLLLDSCTVTPPEGASQYKVTVPVTLAGPTTGFGFSDKDSTPMGRTLS
jgi:hypothetical protein